MTRELATNLTDPQIVALCCRGADWPRSRFSQTPIPEGWMGLLIKPDGRRRFLPAGDDPRPDATDILVLVRNQPNAVPLDVTDVPAADGHLVRAGAELLLACPARDDEIASLHRALLADGLLTATALAEAVKASGADAALKGLIRSHPARELVTGDFRQELFGRLRDELKRFLFSAGLVLEQIGQLTFSSESLARQETLRLATQRRLEELQARDMVERAALAATQRRLDDLAGVLSKLKAAAEVDGTLRWRDLLPTLTPGERGRLLESLWRITPNRTTAQALVVITDRECVFLDPADPERILRQLALPGELGGLRSVTFDPATNLLLVGAACGVYTLCPTTGQLCRTYPVPNRPTPRTGFNAVAICGARVVASHSQLGAWSWELSDPAEARPMLEPAGGVPKTIRAATAQDPQRVLLAGDNLVLAYDLTGQKLWQSSPTDSSIHCLAVLEDRLFVGTARGTLACWDRSAEQWSTVYRTSAPIESIAARRWDDLIELVIPAGMEGVCAVYPDEGLVSRLLDVDVPVRRTWACDDALLALSEQRDRLILLNGSLPARRGREVPVARMLGRLVQDACILVGRPEPLGALNA